MISIVLGFEGKLLEVEILESDEVISNKSGVVDRTTDSSSKHLTLSSIEPLQLDTFALLEVLRLPEIFPLTVTSVTIVPV